MLSISVSLFSQPVQGEQESPLEERDSPPSFILERLTAEGFQKQQDEIKESHVAEGVAKTSMGVGLGIMGAGMVLGGCGFNSLIDGESYQSPSLLKRYRGPLVSGAGFLLFASGAIHLYGSAGDWEDSHEERRQIQAKSSLFPLLKERYGEERAKEFARDFSGTMTTDEFIEKYALPSQETLLNITSQRIRDAVRTRLQNREVPAPLRSEIEDKMVKEKMLSHILSDPESSSPTLSRLSEEIERTQQTLLDSW